MASAVEALIRTVVTKGATKVSEFNRSRRRDDGSPHPYLTGMHQPMDSELTLADLRIEGSIPADLNGRYIRIGPNPVEPPDPMAYHWFLGEGMVHGLKLKGGKVEWYRNRWIKSRAVSAALGQPAAPGPRNGDLDSPNTNIIVHGGETWAIIEGGGYPVRIDKNLETIAHDPFGGTLKGSFSAHPHLDPDTGELHAICWTVGDPDTIRHVVVDASGKVSRDEPVRVNAGPMIHDCMITKNYAIILDLPVTFSMKRFIGGDVFPFAWNPKHEARVGLLPRNGKGEDTIWCPVDPCFVFHPCNGYEQADGTIVLDVCAYRNMFAGDANQGPDTTDSRFERWIIDPIRMSVERRPLDSEPQEFPRFDERLTGKPYRYAYTIGEADHSNGALLGDTRLFKHDLVSGTKRTRNFGTERHPGEFVFVPKSPDAAEDEGWLLGFVVDMVNDTTEFVILNAQEFEGTPRAVVHIPHRIPAGFHGNWIAG